MKFLSIFASRSAAAADAATDTVGLPPPDGAMRAAGLFGIPQQQMTPQVRAAFNALMGELEVLRTDREELRLSLALAEQSADHDPLVPVYNRRAFMRETSRICALVKRHEIEASLIYFDLDGFKEVNDVHGHAAGDAVLRAIGETLIRQTRQTDIVGRIGGDEFAVALTHLDPPSARQKAEQLLTALREERVRLETAVLEIGASFGIVPFEPGESAERMLARADEAMYVEKRAARRARA